MSRRLVVTGGGGFIGSHVVERLLAQERCVTVIDDFSTGARENLAAVAHRIELVEGDLHTVLTSRLLAFDQCDAVVHFAGNPYVPWSVDNPPLDFDLNLRNSFELLETLRACRTPPLFVNVSSAAVYGDPGSMAIREADPTVPISPYGVSKLAAEAYARAYSHCFGLRTVSLRLFSVYGPRQRKQVVFDLIRKCRATPHRIEVLGDGTQERDLVYVTDVADAVVMVLEKAPARGEAYNVASMATYSLATLVDAITRACGVTPEIAWTGRVRPGDAQRWTADSSLLQALGWRPAVSLTTGLEAVRAWYDASDPEPARPATTRATA